jgi:hypothetical protein
MRLRKSKKSSLNISINAIVIIVLAMTFLGLGLGFVRNMFGGISETAFSVQDQIKQQILDDLRTGDKKLSFPTTEVQIPHRDAKVLAIGVKNTEPSRLEFTIDIVVDSTDVGEFKWDDGTQTLGINEANVFPIKLTAGDNPDTYIIKVKIMDLGGEEYASKSFFVTVT